MAKNLKLTLCRNYKWLIWTTSALERKMETMFSSFEVCKQKKKEHFFKVWFSKQEAFLFMTKIYTMLLSARNTDFFQKSRKNLIQRLF